MNFVQARVEGSTLLIGDHRIALPEALINVTADRDGDILVGLRPEDFSDARVGTPQGETIIPAEVEITEQLGPETYVYFRVPGFDVVEIGERPVELPGALCARLDPRTTAAPGERLDLALNPHGIRLFDPQSGDALSLQQ